MISTQQLHKSTNFGTILQQCLLGHRKSQEMLYHFYAPRMFGICLRYAHDYQSAQDILQEGFIKVFNHLDQFHGKGSFEGWIKRIFVNTSIEHYQKAKVLRFVNLDDAPPFAIEPPILQRLVEDDLIKEIQKLPDGYRTIFNLYVIEGYTHPEIAKMLQISEGTSKSQLARARNSLKKQLT